MLPTSKKVKRPDQKPRPKPDVDLTPSEDANDGPYPPGINQE